MDRYYIINADKSEKEIKENEAFDYIAGEFKDCCSAYNRFQNSGFIDLPQFTIEIRESEPFGGRSIISDCCLAPVYKEFHLTKCTECHTPCIAIDETINQPVIESEAA